MQIKRIKNGRWPKLDTLMMIEAQRDKKDWESKRELWLSLPRKVMWQTFLIALDYLDAREMKKEEENKIKQEMANIPGYVY